MTDKPTQPPRVCRNGHEVSVEKRTGRVVTNKRNGRPYLACLLCPMEYERSMRALGLR